MSTLLGSFITSILPLISVLLYIQVELNIQACKNHTAKLGMLTVPCMR